MGLNRKVATAVFALVGGMGATSALADAIPLVNGGFETPDGASTDMVGWNEEEFNGETWRAGTFTPPVAPWGAFTVTNPEGARVGYLNATTRISQNSGHLLTPGETYTLSAWIGNRLDDAQRRADVEIYADNGSGGLGDLLASISIGDELVPNGTYQQLAIGFDTLDPLNLAVVAANAGRSLHVSIAHSQGQTGGGEVAVDDVQFSFTPVPEPASLALVGVAGLACLSRRRRH